MANDGHIQRMLEAANIIPWEADPQTWQFTYVGLQVERLLGYPRDQWYEKDFWTSTILPEDREFAINFCESSTKRLSDFEFEYRMVKADGDVIWLRDIVHVEIEDGVPQLLRGFMIDNTVSNRIEHLYSIAPVGLCYFDSDLRFLYINEWLARINGLSVTTHLGKTIDEVLKDIAAGVVPQLRHVLQTGEPIIEGEVEAVTPAHPDESRHYMHNYYPDTSKDGTVVGVSCVVQDITEKWQVEEALRQAHEQLEARVQDRTKKLRSVNAELKTREKELRKNAESLHKLTGRLIVAQEDERRRIGRELHDGLTQNLAAMAIDADRLAQEAKATGGTNEYGLNKIKDGLIELSKNVHSLSLQLHPAIVEDFGIALALQSLCEEVQQNEGVQIDYEADAIPADIPTDHALCVYRVVQEALRNIVKHSRATRAQVHLHSKSGTLKLKVSDNGRGFNLDAAINQSGLGLRSIEERVCLVGGTARVETGSGEEHGQD